MGASTDELQMRAEMGDSEAQIALACRFESEQRNNLARGWFARAAKQGSVPALRRLAINLLTQAPIVGHDGVNMIRSAAHKGDAEAAYVCGMLAAQDHHLENRWSIARECLERAAARDWAPAQEQLSFLSRMGGMEDLSALTAPLQLVEVSASPRIAIVENFASDEICDWLVARARPRIGRAMVYDKELGGGLVEGARSNSAVSFDVVQSDIILMLIRARIAATAQSPPDTLEPTATLHYAVGQSFEPHVDFLDPATPGYAADLRAKGQRVATFLVYLNDDYEGGETDFPAIGWRYRGRKGGALLFWNVTSEGAPDPRMLHAGLPPSSGEKWLLSQWIRQSPTSRS
jgi:prolyl 4-hydroxylase